MPTKYYTEDATFAANNGVDIDGTTADIIITPINPANNQHTGYFIEAKNFTIGGGEESDGSSEAATGTNIWENLASTWNADVGVKKVTFTNIGNAGDINNTVKAAVLLNDATSATTPTADKSFHVDIDEGTANPISNTLPRTVCFFLKIPYSNLFSHEFYEPTTTPTTWTTASNPIYGVTRTLTGTVPTQNGQFYYYKFEGTITDYNPVTFYDICRVAFVRTNPVSGVSIDPLPGAGDVDFSEFDHFFIGGTNPFYYINAENDTSSVDYSSSYNVESYGVMHNTSLAYVVYYDIKVDPLDSPAALELEQGGGMCLLGHEIYLGVFAIDMPNFGDGSEFIIKSLSAPSKIASSPGYKKIIVRGTPGATYDISLVQAASTTSVVPAATNAYYNFGGTRGFQSTNPINTYTIGAKGKNSHPVLITSKTAKSRYDVYVMPTGVSTASSSVPTKAGDKFITQQGISTITISATGTSGLFNTSGAAASTTIKRRVGARQPSHLTTFSLCSATISSSTRLVLSEVNHAISEGMYVTIPMSGAGVPHATTVVRVDKDIITLSAASSITAGVNVRFDRNTTSIFPFTLTVPAGGTSGSFKNLSAIAENHSTYLPGSALGGTSGFSTVVTAGSTSTDEIVLAAPGVQQSLVGMALQGPGISHNGKNYVLITAGEISGKTITVAGAQTIASGVTLTVSENPDSDVPITTSGIDLFHVHAAVTTDGGGASSLEVATVYGYVDVGQVSNSATLPLYVENLLTSVAF